jgi:UDP-N-acetylglucosamine 1-carboxyvinyltransferase
VDRLVIRPSGPLEGTVRAGGAKNSALKLMAACLLAEGRHELRNVPRILDVQIMSEMLEALGVVVRREDDLLVVEVPPAGELSPVCPYELVEKMRASLVVLGPLLARCGHARLSMPGGDDFGSRPINFHLDGLSEMGTVFSMQHGIVDGTVDAGAGGPRLTGARIVLDYPSHTTTDNLMMAAALAKGTTVIDNAAREPEVLDLADYLNQMGASVAGAGTSRLEITGVEGLTPGVHTVIPDRVVAGTLLAAAAIAGGEVVVEDGRFDHMEMYVSKLRAMGVEVDQRPEGLAARGPSRLSAVDVATLPFPGVATDYAPLLVAMLSVADGVSIMTENLFEGRFRYVDELRRLGADVRTEGHHAVVRGVGRLSGAPVRAPDIRGGAALALAGMVADGETTVNAARHIDRGYEHFGETLRSLGADVDWQ